jgi:Flp pilus assembly pilin Flp/ribosomal protein S27AE
MPSSRKINLEKVLAALDTVCPKCGKVISPAEVRSIDFEHVECPACGEQFIRRRLNSTHGGANMIDSLRNLWLQEDGQDIAEYAVMLAVILVIVVGTLRLIGGQANNVFSSVASSIGQ